MWRQPHIRPKNENIAKKFFPFNGLYLILMSSLLKSSFLHNLKTFILGSQINGSFPFFDGFLFIRSLNYTPKIRSLSQKLWPQAIVKKGFKICMVSKIKKQIVLP